MFVLLPDQVLQVDNAGIDRCSYLEWIGIVFDKAIKHMRWIVGHGG